MSYVFERLLIALMTWAFAAFVGFLLVAFAHVSASFAFWDWIPIRKAYPLWRMAAALAVLPAVAVALYYNPDVSDD